MREKLSCEIVKDLIPLSSEGLCSEESRAAIETHVQECESCRRLFAQLPEVEAPEAPVPDEGKAFRKINKKLKNRLVKTIALGIVLLFVLGGLGYLSIGQVMKSHGQQSFETVWQSIEVRRLAKMVAEGDIDSYAKEASVGDLLDSMIYEPDFDVIRSKDVQLVQAAWQAAYGGEKVSSINVDTYYAGYGPGLTTIPYSTAFIHYESGRNMQLHFQKEKDGLYSATASGAHPGEKSEAEFAFSRVLSYMSKHEVYTKVWISETITNEKPVIDEEKAAQKTGYVAGRFAPEWHDDIEGRMVAFYLSGYCVTKFDISNILFDKNEEALYHNVTVIAEDGQGSAVLLTRFYSGAGGLSPAPERNRVFSDGCTDALTADLAALFG